MITGSTLIQWGFEPGRHFSGMLHTGNEMHNNGYSDQAIFEYLQTMVPVKMNMRTHKMDYASFLNPVTEDEKTNTEAVFRDMDALMRVPTIVAGAVMPDACPAGTIPVGGVVATKDAIHPGFHSADICCSMALTTFARMDDPSRVLDIAQKITHFGRGFRSKRLVEFDVGHFKDNRFLSGLEEVAKSAMSTQGDGNHFLYVGDRDGKLTLVTHHGSRNLGALLYKRGMQQAIRHTKIVSPKTPTQNAWLDVNTDIGRDYWDALQWIRHWTKMNHYSLHNAIAQALGNKVIDRFWNEHNFVFRRDDGLFYHAKGATPSYDNFSDDTEGRVLIPLNMAEPILIAETTNNKNGLGFAPHGAGRNMSRTRYLRDIIGDRPIVDVITAETKGLDVRFYCGTPDLSELPGAYKNARSVSDSITNDGLARVTEVIHPYGCIMAGEEDKPWKK